jgi:ATP-binding cassette, subfamily F, member 3
MLSVQNISKSYGVETILSGISFNVNSGERLGLVGANGSGKTTLLKILAGLEPADEGAVAWNPPSLRVGYLPQGLQPGEGELVGEFLARAGQDLTELESEVERLASALVHAPDQDGLQEAYDLSLARLLSASESSGRAAGVLAALGLDEVPRDLPVAALSGGQKTRLALAGVLLDDPQFLLLDEPTNHLDLEMLAWLEGWLANFRGAALVVSHDRTFLDRVATGILEIDPVRHTLRQYAGGYSVYLEQKLAERERKLAAYHDQQQEIARLQKSIAHLQGLAKMRKGGKADSGDKFAAGFFANRSRRTVGRSKQLERRIERMMNEDRVEKPRQTWQMKLEFGQTEGGRRDALTLEKLSVGYNGEPLLENLNLHLRRGARAVLLGPNGSGKTTLLRTIAGALPPITGRVRLGGGIKLGFMRQEQEDLDPDSGALDAIRRAAPVSETEARSFLHKYLFAGDDVFIPAGLLSYGERARLSLACLVAEGCNFLLLDEPINHLDIPSRTRFEQALASFEGAVLAVVHDRYFIEGFASEIWEVQGKGIYRYEVDLSGM